MGVVVLVARLARVQQVVELRVSDVGGVAGRLELRARASLSRSR